MGNNVITLRNVYKVKEIHFQPRKQSNGQNFPFVKKVRYNSDGTSEMICSEAERNSPEFNSFIPEDLDIVVTDGTTFDLDDPLQRNIWDSIKDSELIVPTRTTKDASGNNLIDGSIRRFGVAELIVDIPGEESQRSVNRIRQVAEAYRYILEDSENGRITKAKLLGRDMYNAPSSDVADFLLKIAEKSPLTIKDLYTSTDTALRLLLIDALQKMVIRKDDGLFKYGDNILGATEDSVILFFKQPDNKNIVDLVKYDVYPEMRKVTTPTGKAATTKAAK